MFTGNVLDKGLSLIRISVIKLSLVCLFMKTIASYLVYTGYLNFIKHPLSHVLLLLLVHVLLRTALSVILTSCLTAIKKHVMKYCETVYERSSKNLFWSIKNSGENLNKLKSKGFLASNQINWTNF